MAWHRKSLLLLLSILIYVKIFGFDPGEDDTASPNAGLTNRSAEETPYAANIHTSEKPVLASVSEALTSDERLSGSVTNTHTLDENVSKSLTTSPNVQDNTQGWALRDQTPHPEYSAERSTYNVSTLTVYESPGTLQDVQTLSTSVDGQYTHVDEHGNVSFSHDSTFNISMSECSMSAYLESYAVLGDLSLFQSLSLTTDDTEPCSGTFTEPPWFLRAPNHRLGRDAGQEPRYLRNGSLIFSSNDEWFVSTNGSVSQSTPAFCLRLRTPPYTDLSVRAVSVQPWVKSAGGLQVELYKEEGHSKTFLTLMDEDKLAKGGQIRSPANTVVLVVKGLLEAFQEPGRRLALSLTAEPTCHRPRLEVESPTHYDIGRFIGL